MLIPFGDKQLFVTRNPFSSRLRYSLAPHSFLHLCMTSSCSCCCLKPGRADQDAGSRTFGLIQKRSNVEHGAPKPKCPGSSGKCVFFLFRPTDPAELGSKVRNGGLFFSSDPGSFEKRRPRPGRALPKNAFSVLFRSFRRAPAKLFESLSCFCFGPAAVATKRMPVPVIIPPSQA
jgi:hypothetical protein